MVAHFFILLAVIFAFFGMIAWVAELVYRGGK